MKLHSETLCIQAGYAPKNGEPRQIPIIQSTTFRYETADAMAKPTTQPGRKPKNMAPAPKLSANQ